METPVPENVMHELTQILSNLVLGDNDIRTHAENVVNERLAQNPELYLLALAQFATTADTEVMRSFSLVLLRRLLFRSYTPAAPSSQSSSSQNGSQSSASSSQQQQRQPPTSAGRTTLYDHLSPPALSHLERFLLHSLSAEPSPAVRRKAVDSVTDYANQSMLRGRPWHVLQVQAFAMVEGTIGAEASGGAVGREAAYRVFEGCPGLVGDLSPDGVCALFERGLRDPESVEVRLAALRASVTYLSTADRATQAHILSLMHPMLETLPALAAAHGQGMGGQHTLSPHLPTFLSTLTPLATAHPHLFGPHLPALLTFLPPLVLPVVDSGPTPTVGRPFGGTLLSGDGGGSVADGQGGFEFPPRGGGGANGAGSDSGPGGSAASADADSAVEDDADDTSPLSTTREETRRAALEFMVSLSESRPSLVRRQEGWSAVVVRACLEGMGEIGGSYLAGGETVGEEGRGGGRGKGEEEELRVWLDADPSDDPSDALYPTTYEQALDRLALALGGAAVLPITFQYIPGMLASMEWRHRHAALMAIASVGEGTGSVLVRELGKVVDLVTPMFRDPHPRVRHAACQCVGQLCTDLEEVIQEQYHAQLFSVLIPTLEAPESRVHAHAAAALINFCEGVERDTLIPYLDPIVERLLRLLNPPSSPADGSADGGGGAGAGETPVKRYVQEQAVTTLAMVADASEATFGKHYASIFPMLMNVLRNAHGPEHRKLRVKAMECAGLIAIAVGRDVFRPDANEFVELLIGIQNAPADPSDTMLPHYLIATWAKVCQALGPEFEPYLPVVMDPLLRAASTKADVSVFDGNEDTLEEEREGWETTMIDGQQVGIRTSAIEEKCQAFETLVIYASTLGGRFAPYLPQVFDIVLPALRFYFHDGVREASALMIPLLLVSGKQSNTLTQQMVIATFTHLLNIMAAETDASFLSSLYRSFLECMRVIGGAASLPPEYREGALNAVKVQLHVLSERRRIRARRVAMDQDDREDMALVEEMEDFALEDMGKVVKEFDVNHPLLVAIGSVVDLGVRTEAWDSEHEVES